VLTCQQINGRRAKRVPVSYGEEANERIHGRKLHHLHLKPCLVPTPSLPLHLRSPNLPQNNPANKPPPDVLQPSNPLLRLMHRRLHHQIPHPARDRLRIAVRQEVYGGKREDRSEVPGTAGADDESASSGEIDFGSRNG